MYNCPRCFSSGGDPQGVYLCARCKRKEALLTNAAIKRAGEWLKELEKKKEGT